MLRLGTVFLTAMLALPAAVVAADYPASTVTIVSGFPPGGGSDRVARIVAAALSAKWKVPVVVETQPGADGTIAADQISKATPDGYRLLWMTSNQTSTPSLRKLPFDPVKGFNPITVVASGPQVLTATPSFPVDTVQQLIDHAKAEPGKINFGTTGKGGPPYLGMVSFMRKTGTKLTHVPFKGSAEATPALLAGEINIMFQNPLSSRSALEQKQLKAIAITGKQRSPILPDVPTFGEAGITELDNLTTWYGLSSPAATPQPIVDQIWRDTVEVMRDPATAKSIADGGLDLVLSNPADTQARIVSEIKQIHDLLNDGSVPETATK